MKTLAVLIVLMAIVVIALLVAENWRYDGPVQQW